MLNILYQNTLFAASVGNNCNYLIQNLHIFLHSTSHIHFLLKVKIVQCYATSYRLPTMSAPFKFQTVQLLDPESLVSNFGFTNLLPRVAS